MCELTLRYPDLEKPKCASDVKIRFTLLVTSLSMKNGVLFPLPRPFFSAVPWASGTPLLLLACKLALTALQPSLLPSSVSKGPLSGPHCHLLPARSYVPRNRPLPWLRTWAPSEVSQVRGGIWPRDLGCYSASLGLSFLNCIVGTAVSTS